jgi:hypothetical protein
MAFWEAIVFIVAIGAIASVVKAHYRAKHGIVADEDGNERPAFDPEAARLKGEVAALKERIAVLERLATDDNSARNLDREIEKLR